jgi:hypothetical protein
MFQHCQRQWYIKQYVANANAKKDPIRREAYLLSTLQSLAAWRGSIVDTVISEKLIPQLNRGFTPTKREIISQARQLYETQLAFALDNRMREPGMTKKQAGETFAALYPVEYDMNISQQELDQAWAEVETALDNLYEMPDILPLLQHGKWLVAQRPLIFTCHGVRARMVPDLIVFYTDEAPLIVDWKVHSFGTHDARLQLASYALALTGCEPHADFREALRYLQPFDIRLLEVQLLTGGLRPYELTQSDVDDVESYISRTNMEMALVIDEQENPQWSIFDFPATSQAETCQRCSFRSLCWLERDSE